MSTYSRDVIFQPKGQVFIEVKDHLFYSETLGSFNQYSLLEIWLSISDTSVWSSWASNMVYIISWPQQNTLVAVFVCLFVFNQRQKDVCPEDRLIHSNILRLKGLLFALSALYISFLYYSCVCLVWCYFCRGLFCLFFFFF